jgi:hypothetical protein
VRIGGEGFGGGCQHPDDRRVRPALHLSHDLRPVHIGAYGVQSYTGLRVFHLGFKKRVNESSHHLPERSALLLLAGEFDCSGDLGEVTCEDSLEERAFVWEVLIQGSDRHAGSQGDFGSGQRLLSDLEQNLKSRFENRVHACCGTRLNRRFTRLQDDLRTWGQMRTPNLKLSSSNHK